MIGIWLANRIQSRQTSKHSQLFRLVNLVTPQLSPQSLDDPSLTQPLKGPPRHMLFLHHESETRSDPLVLGTFFGIFSGVFAAAWGPRRRTVFLDLEPLMDSPLPFSPTMVPTVPTRSRPMARGQRAAGPHR